MKSPHLAVASLFSSLCLSVFLTGECLAELEFTLIIGGDPNTPVVSVINTSTSGEIMTDFELTIGDTDYNFDGVENIMPPSGGQVTLISPDDDTSGGVRSDSIVLAITNFDPGEVITFQTDVDRDNSNSTEDFRSILFNNGDGLEAFATGSSPQGDQTSIIALQDDDLRSSYTYTTTGAPLGEPGASPQNPIADPGSLTTERGNDGKVLYIIVAGTLLGGGVWGTDVYTDDSDLSTAVVHAGVLAENEVGIVMVTILPGQASYEGTTRNGLTTGNFGTWSGSYRVEPVGGGGNPGSGDLGFVLEILDDTNTPTLQLTNHSTDTLAITAFELTIGDDAFNFDGVTDISAPAGTNVTVASPDTNDAGGERSDIIRLDFTGFDPGETVTFVIDVDRDSNNTTEDYRDVLFNNGEAPNAVATVFAGAASRSITLPDAPDAPTYRFESGSSIPGSGDLGFVLEILDDTNTPTLQLTNQSTGTLAITGFELTIGDDAFNFDGVTDISAPAGTNVTVASPDTNDAGGERSDIIRLDFTGFDPGETVTFVIDVDRDSNNTTEDYRDVLFNNGEAPNAVATVFAGAASRSITLPDAPDAPTYRFESGSSIPGSGDLGFVLEILDDTNTPTLQLTNQSTGTLAITAFELTIGDDAFNFDGVTDISAPAGTNVTVASPDTNDAGGERSDIIRLNFTGFDPGETVTFVIDVDRDSNNTTEDYRDVLFNNGEAPNAVATCFAGVVSISITFPDGPDQPSYVLHTHAEQTFQITNVVVRGEDLEITFPTERGELYQVQGSRDLRVWLDIGSEFEADSDEMRTRILGGASQAPYYARAVKR